MMAGTVLVCTLVACNKEQEVKEETNPENEVELVTEVIRASWDEGETKGNIAEVGGAFTWSEGDKIAVHTNNDGGTWYYSQALVAGDEGQTSANFTTTFAGTRDAVAVFPNSLVTEGADALSSGLTVTLPSSYRLADVLGDKAPTPMVADNTQDVLSFKHLCGLLRLTINGIPAEATKLTVDFLGRQVHGDFTIAAGNLTPGDAACIISTTSPSANDVITITGLDGSVNSVTVNIPLPAGTYDDVVITPYNGDDALELMAVRHIKGGSYTASRAHRRKLTATLVSFSVAADKKVVFAPGNLQATYDGSAWTWHFAEHQYDVIGNNGGNLLVTSSEPYISGPGTVDLFGWVGTGSSFEGIAQYGIHSSQTNSDYSPGASLMHNWGTLAISDYAPGFWRTPTSGSGGEFQYMLGGHSGGDIPGENIRASSTVGEVTNARYAHAYLMGTTHGLIIFPDTYTHPSDVAVPVGINIFDTNSEPYSDLWRANQYTSEQWGKMEAAGAIFLPIGGRRKGNAVDQLGPETFTGRYWSTVAANSTTSYVLYILATESQTAIGTKNYWQVYGGFSVRLVRDL